MSHQSPPNDEFPVRAEQMIASWKAFNEELRLINEALGIQPVPPPRSKLHLLEGGTGRSSP